MSLATAIVQARMASSRLPGKILRDLQGEPMLVRVIDRVKRARLVEQVAVATSVNPEDDAVQGACEARGITVTRGSSSDVLERYHAAAIALSADPIVRVTADCPLVDPGLIDDALDFYKTHAPSINLVTNVLPPTFPDGLDYSIFSFSLLDRARANATLPSEREHVVPWMWKQAEQPASAVSMKNMTAHRDCSRFRWTVDYAADLAFMNRVYSQLYESNPAFAWTDVLTLVESDPSLQALAANVARDEGYLESLRRDGEKS